MKSLKLNKAMSTLLISSALCGVMISSTHSTQAHADINDRINNALQKSNGSSVSSQDNNSNTNINVNTNVVGSSQPTRTGTTSDELSKEINNLNSSADEASVSINNSNNDDLTTQILDLLKDVANFQSSQSQSSSSNTNINTNINYNGLSNYVTANGASNLISGTSTLSSDQAQRVVSTALQLAQSNIPYVWGGESLSGMDCSGLTDYVYRNALGVSLGHYTVTQESHVITKPVAQAQPGDLLFWGNHGATHHVAIYVGNNQYVAAPQPGQNVDLETINSAFMPSFAGSVKG